MRTRSATCLAAFTGALAGTIEPEFRTVPGFSTSGIASSSIAASTSRHLRSIRHVRNQQARAGVGVSIGHIR